MAARRILAVFNRGWGNEPIAYANEDAMNVITFKALNGDDVGLVLGQIVRARKAVDENANHATIDLSNGQLQTVQGKVMEVIERLKAEKE
jgi:uncharacterized protein YlzI (FlbEa/FlbD family)